jgi:photosystem II stability/assembly factor-like uncharacterized protein
MNRHVRINSLLTTFVTLILLPAAAAAQGASITAEQLEQLRFRQPGPAVTGGRLHDVEALPHDPSTIYLATASGGIWKSTNKGTTWMPIFDNQAVSTFGDIAIAPSNDNVIWAGTGEQNNRQSTSYGNGVYRSTDGGTTWTHLGLEATRHIGAVQVHPQDPDIAYVAALGNLWRPTPERGVYKTTNGGRSWDKVLFVDTLTGVVDLSMDPNNPDVLYAAAYQRLRRAWGFNGGGPGSGIYKTTNGGRSWRELTNGIPGGDKGRIGLAIAKTNPQILNATIEHASEGGSYRTEDGGANWERVNELNQRPMYYSEVFIDPTNENRVYELATSFYKSEDGGHTFRNMPIRPTYDVGVHSDFHGLWIDPTNPEHFYLAGDAGLYESWDGGTTFIRINNIPIAQFYAIGADNREPYFIYGGLQDNHSWMGPSATRHWIGIINDDWRQIGFGDGMYHQPDPTDHRFEYGTAQNGSIVRLNTETGDLLDVRPYPPEGEPDYRWDWVTPILVSQHDSRVVYFGGNRLFISRDRGVSWNRTQDLTRQIDRDTLTLMGVAGSEIGLSRNDGTSSYGEIVTIAESPWDPDVIWVGTDDGNIQLSQDGGNAWAEVARNVSGVARGTYVSRVIASATDPGTAYATFDAHRDGDFRPYVFRTEDFGANWEPLTDGLPSLGSANVIREHPHNPDLLFLGTEHALFVSTDRGRHWTHFKANLPTTLFDDLIIQTRANDLIVGTHGRSLWILDDLTPLVEWSSEVAEAPAHLFSVPPARIMQYWKDTSYRGQNAYAGENPPDGAILNYVLGQEASNAVIEITNDDGRVVRHLAVTGEAGVIHRAVWDLRHEAPPSFTSPFGGTPVEDALPRLPHAVTPRGPSVSPGVYTATLTAGNARSTQSIIVRGDSTMPVTVAQYRDREEFLLEVLEGQRHVADLLDRAAELEGEGSVADSVDALQGRLRQLRRQISNLAGQFNGNGVRQGSLYPPTDTQRMRWRQMRGALEREREALAQLERRVGG